MNQIFKCILYLLCLFLYSSAQAEETISLSIQGSKLYYHYIRTRTPSKGLVIFLHGSVSAFKGKTSNDIIAPTLLLENNNDFIPVITDHGYDIIMPVAFNEYNWLETKGNEFIDSILNRHSADYSSVIIAGFSDGGTGAYRQFYRNTKVYDGLLVFNGYPQLGNFYKKVDYKSCTSKNIVFVSQQSDKVIPYEFLLTEYRRQKMINNNTFFILYKGAHEFIKYSKRDFEELIGLIEHRREAIPAGADSIMIFPAIDGFVVDNNVKRAYIFKEKVGKKWGMNHTEYKSTNTGILNGEIERLNIYPLCIQMNDLSLSSFEFKGERNGTNFTIKIPNYLVLKTWK